MWTLVLVPLVQKNFFLLVVLQNVFVKNCHLVPTRRKSVWYLLKWRQWHKYSGLQLIMLLPVSFDEHSYHRNTISHAQMSSRHKHQEQKPSGQRSLFKCLHAGIACMLFLPYSYKPSCIGLGNRFLQQKTKKGYHYCSANIMLLILLKYSIWNKGISMLKNKTLQTLIISISVTIDGDYWLFILAGSSLEKKTFCYGIIKNKYKYF